MTRPAFIAFLIALTLIGAALIGLFLAPQTMIDIERLREDVFECCSVCGKTLREHDQSITHEFKQETDHEYFLRRKRELLPP